MMSTLISDKIFEAALETLERNCFMFPLDKNEIEEEQVAESQLTEICSVVKFHGAVKGAMKVRPSFDLFTALGANMLGVDQPDPEEKKQALTEVANIICGNIVPVFSTDKDICYLEPPKIKECTAHPFEASSEYEVEDVSIHLNEGLVQIELYYENGGRV